MPRLEDILAYASLTLLGLGLLLGASALWVSENVLRAGDAQRLCLLGAAACAGAVLCVLASARMSERRLRREERRDRAA